MIHWKAVEQYFTLVLCIFLFYPVFNFDTLSILDLALSRAKGFGKKLGHDNDNDDW